MKTNKIHRRYSDKEDRDDLRSLALCNNINGAVFPLEALTSRDFKVTCGSCRRIMGEDRVHQARRLNEVSPYIGKKVTLLPMSIESCQWADKYGTTVTLVKWEAETCTVRAKSGKKATFGPREAAWMAIQDDMTCLARRSR
jgi:hypothetical protein